MAESGALQALLEEGACETPAKCQKRLWRGGFHVSRKEIENYRSRQKAALRAQALPTLGVDEMLGRLAAADVDDLLFSMVDDGQVRRKGLNVRAIACACACCMYVSFLTPVKPERTVRHVCSCVWLWLSGMRLTAECWIIISQTRFED